MCTRGVWQCKSLMLQYCKHGGSSAGVRDFVERMLVPFAEANPQMSIAISHKVNRHPIAQAFYVQDAPKRLSLRNLSAEQVASRARSRAIGTHDEMALVGVSRIHRRIQNALKTLAAVKAKPTRLTVASAAGKNPQRQKQERSG